MSIVTTSIAIGTVAGYSVMKKTLGHLQDLASGELKKKLKRLSNEKKQAEIAAKIRKIGVVKTLLDSRVEVDLNSIYHPTKVRFDECENEVRVGHVGKLPDSSGVLIEGTVGQGKSTFMRFLVCSMARADSRIPIFLELRNIRKEEKLIDALKRQLDVYGFESDDELFDFYCKSGKFVLFLDGFDEIRFEDVQGVVVELGDLRHKYNSTLKIIVSSRPRGGLSYDPLFQVVSILPILDDDRLEFLTKIDHDKERSERLALALKESNSEIIHVLRTPLMLTLLCKIHSAYNQIPESFIEFYEKLFMAMYRDHDDRKPGFSRRIRSRLNPNQVEEAFSLFSFLCSVEESYSFNESDYYRLMSKAINKAGFKASVDGLMEDVVDISCMIIKEGSDYSFIHKSICEYYAAKYICSMSEEFKKTFYKKILTNFESWRQQLTYLMEIDSVAFYKYFYVPSSKTVVKFRDDIKILGSKTAIKELLAKVFIGHDEDADSRHIDYKEQLNFQRAFDFEISLDDVVMTRALAGLEKFSVDLSVFDEIDVQNVYVSLDERSFRYVDGRNLIDNEKLIAYIEGTLMTTIHNFDNRLEAVRLILAVDKSQNDMLDDLF